MKKRLTFFALLLSSITAYAQYVTSGKVIDKYGNPISEAKVLGKGTSQFVTTGMDGSYSLETSIPIKGVEVSGLGKQKKIQSVSKKHPYTIVKLKDYSIWNDHPDKYHWFLGLQANAGLQKCFPIGFMGGYVKRFGFYVRGVFSSSLPSTKESIPAWAYLPKFVFVDAETSYISITAGGMMHVVGPLYLYAGAGYANRKIAMKHANGDFYEINAKEQFFPEFQFDYLKPYANLCIDGGLMLDIHHFTVNIGTAVSGSIACQLGVGYRF